MSQLSTVVAQVEIKSSADKFFAFLKDKIPQMPTLFPEIYKSFNFLEGNKIQDGAVIYIEYELGSKMAVKEKLEVDDSSRSINFALVEGDILAYYTSCKLKIQVNNGYVDVAVEFEKAIENSPDLGSYVVVFSDIIKQLDAYAVYA